MPKPVPQRQQDAEEVHRIETKLTKQAEWLDANDGRMDRRYLARERSWLATLKTYERKYDALHGRSEG